MSKLNEEDFVSHDDINVMRILLEQVKGLSFVSSSPVLVLSDDENPDVVFE
jgi:hypothetical protein